MRQEPRAPCHSAGCIALQFPAGFSREADMRITSRAPLVSHSGRGCARRLQPAVTPGSDGCCADRCGLDGRGSAHRCRALDNAYLDNGAFPDLAVRDGNAGHARLRQLPRRPIVMGGVRDRRDLSGWHRGRRRRILYQDVATEEHRLPVHGRRPMQLVFTGGESMGGPAVQSLVGNVNTGQTVDLSVALTAPATNGSHTGSWALRNSARNHLLEILRTDHGRERNRRAPCRDSRRRTRFRAGATPRTPIAHV